MSAELVIHGDGLEALDRLIQFPDHPGVLLGEIREYLLESTRHRIAAEKESPDGVPWAPVSPGYAKRKAADQAGDEAGDQRSLDPADLLRLTHQMVSSLGAAIDGSSLVVGSPEPYAAAHQDSQRAWFPSRPWLGFSRRDVEEVQRLVVVHLQAVADGRI